MLTLFHAHHSTCSQKVRICLAEKGLEWTDRRLNLAANEHLEPGYLELNPNGVVPTLTHDGNVIIDSSVIIEYLEDRFPETPRLIPAEKEAARQVRFMDRTADLYFNEPVLELLFQHIGFRPKNAEAAERARRYVDVTYAYWDKRLASQPWLCGEKFTMADCAAIPPLFYAQIAAPFAQHPNVAAYFARAQQRPSYAKVKAECEPAWQAMAAKAQAA